ncbi:MAG: galactose-1-phosphate uridylyltransferase [Steroidobacteraceae bacterium]
MNLKTNSHRRLNLLTGEWVLVSPHRTLRPWQGLVEREAASNLPAYAADCYLCPGNARAGAQRNPAYLGPYAFDNDFPALTSASATATAGGSAASTLFVSEAESGICRVVCFSERHDLYLAEMSAGAALEALRFLVQEWCRLDERDEVAYVQVFENRGEMMGCSNAHPHAQIWATAHLPNELRKELETQRRYHSQHGAALLMDYLKAELAACERVVVENSAAVSLVPFWAVWPYETLILPRRAVTGWEELDEVGLAGFVAALQGTLRALNGLFGTQVPYSMGFHPRPSDGSAHPEWQLHAHIFPPLLRSATVRKHLVGFEMLAMPQRDLTPEVAAAALRAAYAAAS